MATLCYIYTNCKSLTVQLQQLRAVEVHQSTQGRAVRAIFQQVVHWGDPGNQLGRGRLLPVASLHNMKYIPINKSALCNITLPTSTVTIGPDLSYLFFFQSLIVAAKLVMYNGATITPAVSLLSL